ncbi:hypothetical protein [Dactylosporangium sp. CA-139066]|uniref:hypothetical protein n=1 Tax=Dactylosporangium sp. CA-139066 TaxID=3239930 RepID=UPI003D9059DD
MYKTAQRALRAGGQAALVAAITVTAAVATANPASADTVNGCAQGWSQDVGTCIWVDTGAKNTTDHTQWVSQIKVQRPRNASSGFLEAWAGNGPTGVAWYQSGNGETKTWTINKWIKTDSGICGAYTWPGSSDRSIACITIKA